MNEEYYCCTGCREMSFNIIERGNKKIAKCIECEKELEL